MPEKKAVSAREVIADIRVGMTDEQLMAKHQLSIKGLQSLKNKLLAAGLLTQVELEGKTSPGKVAIPPVDKKAFARNIAVAVKAGLSDDEIMKKFGIPAAKLPGVLTSLVKAGYLVQDHLDYRPGRFEQAVELGTEAPVSKGEGQLQNEESARDVLRDFAERFNIPREDLERLKTASLKDIKAFFEKHNIPLSEGKELIQVLGPRVGDFLSEKMGRLKEMVPGLMSKSDDGQANQEANQASDPAKATVGQKISWGQDEKVVASALFAGVVTGWALGQICTESWFWFIIWLPVFIAATTFGYHKLLAKHAKWVKYAIIGSIFLGIGVIGNIGAVHETADVPATAVGNSSKTDGEKPVESGGLEQVNLVRAILGLGTAYLDKRVIIEGFVVGGVERDSNGDFLSFVHDDGSNRTIIYFNPKKSPSVRPGNFVDVAATYKGKISGIEVFVDGKILKIVR